MVEAEALDELFEPRAAQDLLADGLQPRLQRARHGRRHELLGQLLAVDQYRGRRLIDPRDERGEAQPDGQRRGKGDDGKPLAPAPDGQEPVKPGALSRLVDHVPNL